MDPVHSVTPLPPAKKHIKAKIDLEVMAMAWMAGQWYHAPGKPVPVIYFN